MDSFYESTEEKWKKPLDHPILEQYTTKSPRLIFPTTFLIWDIWRALRGQKAKKNKTLSNFLGNILHEKTAKSVN